MGGIVWKHHSGQQTISIVRNKNNGRGWSLPVLQADGPELRQATRLEKIGLLVGTEVEKMQSADTLFYPEWDPPQFVIYWHLQVKANARQFKLPEYIEVMWLTPRRAAELLTNESEKRLVSKLKYPEESHPEFTREPAEKAALSVDPEQPVNSTLFERLQGDLQSHSAELEFAIRTNLLEDGSIPAWGEQAGALVNISAQHLRRGRFEAARKSLEASKRLALFSLDEKQVPKAASGIRIQAERLNDPAKKSIQTLLGDNSPGGAEIDNRSLYLATQIRDEEYSKNRHLQSLKGRSLRSRLVFLSAAVVLILAYFISLSYLPGADLITQTDGSRSINLVPLLTGTLLFGLFGASFSAFLRFHRTSGDVDQDEFITGNLFSAAKIAAGAASALIVFVLLESNLIGLMPLEFTLQPSSYYTYFLIAFLAGFSERFILKEPQSEI